LIHVKTTHRVLRRLCHHNCSAVVFIVFCKRALPYLPKRPVKSAHLVNTPLDVLQGSLRIIFTNIIFIRRIIFRRGINFVIFFSKNNIFAKNHIYTKNRIYAKYDMGWGGATISRLLKMIGLFCKRALQKRRRSAKETYDFKEPPNRSHPI